MCLQCGTEGWVSDNWLETGVFHFNDQTSVQLGVLHDIGRFIAAGCPLPITTGTLFPDQRRGDPGWIGDQDEDMIAR